MFLVKLSLCLAVLGCVPVSGQDNQQGQPPKPHNLNGGRALHISRQQFSRRGMCHFYGRMYHHGQSFTVPGTSRCITYICNNANVQLRREGCSVRNRCYPVGSTFDSDCSRFTCRKTVMRGYNRYESILRSSRCRDATGRCHTPGRSTFPFVINGRYFEHCTCRVEHTVLRYSCTHPYGKK